MHQLNSNLIIKAHEFLLGKIRKTPMELSPYLSKVIGYDVYLKLESLQITGSFKIRGAFFYISTLSAEEKKKGVAACSAGNHGLGVAFASKEMNVKCTVYVPKNVDEAKHQKMLTLGAVVKKSSFIGYDDTLEWAEAEAKREGLMMISAFNDERIMAGNGGTLAMEIMEEVPDAENFLVPVGGGGLAAGFAYYVKEKNPKARIIACQHRDSPALKLSLQEGRAVTKVPAIETVAGGLEGGLGDKSFEVLKNRVDDVMLVSEEEIIQGFRFILDKHQYLIEPTAAVVIGALLQKPKLKGKAVAVLTGRNVSLKTIKQCLLSGKNEVLS